MARRRGEREPAPDWQIDLHGRNRREALHQLRLALQTCRYQRLSRLRVITGRGNQSPDREPTLAPYLSEWLAGSEARASGVVEHHLSSAGGAIEVVLLAPGDPSWGAQEA